MSELPPGWSIRPLAEIVRRLTRKNSACNNNVLTISAQEGLVSQERYFNKRVASKDLSGYFLLRHGDFAYNKSYSSGYPFGVVKRLMEDDCGVVSPLYICFELLGECEVSPDYLVQYFESGLFNRALGSIAQQGARNHGLLNVKPSEFFALEILLPSLPEQRKIAAILNSVDEVIEKTEGMIEQLQVTKNAMMQELLTHGLPRRHKRFKKTEIGEIPEQWEVRPLREVSSIVRGSTPRPARDPRFFGGRHTPWITVGELAKDDNPYLKETTTFLTEEGSKRARMLPLGTVVLSNSGFGLGVPKILGLSGCANDGIAAFLDLGSRVRPLFLYYWLRSMTVHLRNSVARGVEQPNLNTTLIGDLEMPIPSVTEQDAITEALSVLDSRLTVERTVREELAIMKSALASVLLTGELLVTPDKDAA